MNMYNVYKSVAVILGLLLLLYFSVFLIISAIKREKRKLNIKCILILVLCVCITLGSLIVYGNYAYPFQRELEPQLYEVLELSNQQELTSYRPFWHSAYEAYGLWPESFYFNTKEYRDDNYDWPEMDFNLYTYLIVYGQEIENLSYNIWDMIDVPIRTGAYYGHMVLKENFYADKIFVYRIPKMRIDNDPNNTALSYTERPSLSQKTFLLVITSLYLIVCVEFALITLYKRDRIKKLTIYDKNTGKKTTSPD